MNLRRLIMRIWPISLLSVSYATNMYGLHPLLSSKERNIIAECSTEPSMSSGSWLLLVKMSIRMVFVYAGSDIIQVAWCAILSIGEVFLYASLCPA